MSTANRHKLATEIYAEWTQRLNGLAIRAEKNCPSQPWRELADLIDTEAHTITGIQYARDLARWAGAERVGPTLRTAILALAEAWMRGRSLAKSASISRSCASKLAALKLKRRAYAHGRSVRDQRAHEKREIEADRFARTLYGNRTIAHDVINRHATARGNTWSVAA